MHEYSWQDFTKNTNRGYMDMITNHEEKRRGEYNWLQVNDGSGAEKGLQQKQRHMAEQNA